MFLLLRCSCVALVDLLLPGRVVWSSRFGFSVGGLGVCVFVFLFSGFCRPLLKIQTPPTVGLSRPAQDPDNADRGFAALLKSQTLQLERLSRCRRSIHRRHSFCPAARRPPGMVHLEPLNTHIPTPRALIPLRGTINYEYPRVRRWYRGTFRHLLKRIS